VLKALYGGLDRLLRQSETAFLNYGYAPLDGAGATGLPPELEADRYGVQLYDKVADAVPLRGLDVLEVGCGRGGGAAYLFARHAPSSLTGLDIAERAIAHCRRTHARSGLRFVAGDAERLPFPDDAFDAVVNVESSHCYPSMPRFLAEVARVLRPEGVLLFADLRKTRRRHDDRPLVADVARLREQLAASGLRVVEYEDITANVVRALDLDGPRRRTMIERAAPKLIRAQLLEFAGVPGSGVHDALSAREISYVRMVVRA
jgi:SAM-dependent methyltransferase